MPEYDDTLEQEKDATAAIAAEGEPTDDSEDENGDRVKEQPEETADSGAGIPSTAPDRAATRKVFTWTKERAVARKLSPARAEPRRTVAG